MESTDSSSTLTIAQSFIIQGTPLEVTSFGSGHINDTYKVLTDAGNNGYLLQRINHHVFKNVDELMQNISLVTAHLHKKRLEANIEDEDTVLTPIPSKNGSFYVQDALGNYWRMYNLIANARSYDLVENQEQAMEGGRAFGRFQFLLSDLDPKQIKEVIPDFCHIGSRLDAFYVALAEDKAGRKASIKDEIQFIQGREKKMYTILEMAERGELPLRITHNDTKFNNVLLDENDRSKCVIDLDTVMPGYVAYDYGDAIRTIINRSSEDEVDLTKVTLNIPLFEAYTRGYFEEAQAFITAAEVESLLHGAFLFPYMQGVRFLTDYLNGDTYYKIQHPEHNLQRTRAQLKLVSEMELHASELKSIIDTIAREYQLISCS